MWTIVLVNIEINSSVGVVAEEGVDTAVDLCPQADNMLFSNNMHYTLIFGYNYVIFKF